MDRPISLEDSAARHRAASVTTVTGETVRVWNEYSQYVRPQVDDGEIFSFTATEATQLSAELINKALGASEFKARS